MPRYVIQRKFVASVPKRTGSPITKLLDYAGIDEPPELWMGSKVFTAFIGSLVLSSAPYIYSQISQSDIGFGIPPKVNLPFLLGISVLAFFLSFIAILILYYLHIYYVIADRTKRVEEILPDFLLVVAAHLHAGLTPFSALNAAARPEFGPMEKEIREISARAMGSETFSEALIQLTWRIDSPMLRRTIAFFENGLRSGGKLANLLETSAEEIRDLEELKQETILNARTYTIFLIFILIGGLPLLLAISTEFLSLFTKMQADIKPEDTKAMGNMIGSHSNLSPEFIGNMAVVIIIGTSMLVSVFIGVIMEGKVLFGLKYAPPLALVAYAAFVLVRTVLHGFLSVISG